MANLSYTFAQTCTTSAASGGVAWLNPSNVERPQNNDTYAEASITAADQETDWLVATNFQWERSVPAGAVLTGLIVWIEGYDTAVANSIQCAEAKLVINGAITGTDQSSTATGRILGHDGGPGGGETHQLWVGAEGNTWGTNPTVAEMNASDFGVAFRLKDVADGTPTTIRVDSVMVALYWEKAAECIITPSRAGSGNAESGMAPYNFHAYATDSTWGDCDPDKVAFKWAVSGPAGWSMTVTDPRPGLSVNGQTRDLASDAWGWNMAWWFDVPGTYTVTATMYYNNTSTGAMLTAASNTITVTVAANTRTKYRVAASGGDHTTVAAAFAAAGASNDVWIEIESGHTESVTAPLDIGGNNWLIAAEDGYSVKPLLKRDELIFRLQDKEDVAFVGIKCDSENPANQCSFAGGFSWDGCAVIDCEGDHQNSCFEITSSFRNRRWLMHNFNCPAFDRYVLFLDGSSSDIVIVGGSFADDGTNAAEGYFRIGAANWGQFADLTDQIGASQRSNFLWTTIDSDIAKGFVRSGNSFVHIYQNHLVNKSQIGLVSFGNDTNGNFLAFVIRIDGNTCVLDAAPKGHGRYHSFLCNNIMPAGASMLLNNNGVMYKVHLSHNVISPNQGPNEEGNVTSDAFMGQQISSQPTYFYDVRWAGNMFALTDPSFWSGGNNHYFNHSNGYDVLSWTKYNSYTNGTGTAKHFLTNISGGTFGSAVTSYTPTEWLATSKSTGDIVGGYEQADLPAASDFLPTDTNPINVVATGTHRNGVFVDYRGVIRDSSASTWYIGAVGAEESSSPPPQPPSTSYLGLSAGGSFLVLQT